MRITFGMEQNSGNDEQANIGQEQMGDDGYRQLGCYGGHASPFLWEGSSQERLPGGRNCWGD